MPQTTNPKVTRDMELSPVGPGTVVSQMAAVSLAARNRAVLVNKTETFRLNKIRKLIEKEEQHRKSVQNRVIERTRRSLKEKQAMLNLLVHDYRVDHFITMKPGFSSCNIESKHDARRYVMESRVFNSGFTMKALKPEVHRRLRQLDPDRKYKVFKKKLLDRNREGNVEINRAISDSAFRRMLQDRANWQKYNYPAIMERSPTESAVEQTLKNTVQPERSEHGDESTDVDSQMTQTQSETASREMVLEKRRFRHNVNSGSFGMTMRTLGPVYFQAPAQTAAYSELNVKGS